MTRLYHGSHWENDLAAAIGNTPLIKLRRASEATGCTILGKAEFMIPGGSVKDRTGLFIIADAEKRGTLKPGGTIVEGTAGNTGIGLTLVGNARGYRSVIVMPETQSKEKIDFLRMIGADLRLVPAKPYRDPGNYVHVVAPHGGGDGRGLGQPVRQRGEPRGPPGHAPGWRSGNRRRERWTRSPARAARAARWRASRSR